MANPEPDWRSEYAEAVAVADDLADALWAAHDKELPRKELEVVATARLRRWLDWKSRRA